MNLAIIGASDEELREHLDQAATAADLQISYPEQTEAWRGLTDEDEEWDILVLGPDLPGDRPELVSRLVRKRPLGLVIALIERRKDQTRRLTYAAGAFDVLSPGASPQRLEQAIDRAVEWLRRMEAQMEAEKLRSIGQLAVGVNHEINNPLTGLMGTAELILMENEELPEKVQRDVRIIIRQSRRIQEITTRLRRLDHLRTVPYDEQDMMIDLSGDGEPTGAVADASATETRERPRLLVVEDNDLVLEVLDRYLGDRFELARATDGAKALAAVESSASDLVLLDLTLPDVDGLIVFREMRRIRPGIRVLVSSMDDADERIESALAEGALGWVRKPFHFESLERKLWGAVQEKAHSHTSSL